MWTVSTLSLIHISFTDKAPESVVAGARENAARLKDKIALLDQSLEALQ